MKEENIRTVEKLFLTGGSASDNSLCEHLSKELRLPIEVFNAFEANSIESDIKGHEQASYTQLVGMGIRGLSDAL